MTFGPKESRDAMRRQANVSKFLGTRGNDDLFVARTDAYREAAPREDTLSSAPYRARVRAQKSSRHRPVPVSHARELRAQPGEGGRGCQSQPWTIRPQNRRSQPIVLFRWDGFVPVITLTSLVISAWRFWFRAWIS